MPAEIAKMETRTFIKDILDRFRDRIEKYLSPVEIEMIEEDRKELSSAAKLDFVVKNALAQHDEKSFLIPLGILSSQ
jgi:hypothetical protein